MHVYTGVDIMRIRDELILAYDMTTALNSFFIHDPGAARDQLFQQLYAQQPIQRERQRRLKQSAGSSGLVALPALSDTTDVY